MSSWAAPVRQPRQGWIGEQVFHDEWKHRMTRSPKPNRYELDAPPGNLESVLGVMSETPRRAAVAASFIQWLGTNCGRELVRAAEELRIRLRELSRFNLRSLRHPFLIAWTSDNHRELGINGGIRVVDAVLAQPTDYGLGFMGHWELVRQPDYSADDLEVIERLCIWLGTPEGREFTDRCNEIIQATERQERAKEIHHG